MTVKVLPSSRPSVFGFRWRSKQPSRAERGTRHLRHSPDLYSTTGGIAAETRGFVIATPEGQLPVERATASFLPAALLTPSTPSPPPKGQLHSSLTLMARLTEN